MCRRDFENTPKKINKIKGIRGPKWGFLTLIKEVFENGETFFFVKYGNRILQTDVNIFRFLQTDLNLSHFKM